MEPTHVERKYKTKVGGEAVELHVTHVAGQSDPILTISGSHTMYLSGIRYSNFLALVGTIKEIVRRNPHLSGVSNAIH